MKKKCQHCGSVGGYYIKGQVRGTIKTYFEADGSDGDNTEMYNSLQHTDGKYAYCCDCDKRMFTVGTD